MLRWLHLLLALTLFASSACKPTAPAAIADASTYLPLHIGAATLRAQFAVSPQEQVQGLMHRPSLEADAGMLFVFPAPEPRSFWMRNTSIPLDIAYISPDGTIREIYPLHPFNENGVASRRSDIQFALETNRGWFERNGLKPGAILNMHDVFAGLKARRIDPALYGLKEPKAP